MDFPAYLILGPLQLHPHPLLEAVAFGASFLVARNLRRYRGSNDSVNPAQRLLVATGALFGALLGAKALVLLQHWPDVQQHGLSWETFLQGKTIVGAMLGGWGMVELVKKLVGITVSTGDRFIFPLLVGTAIGRLGCFLTGLEDKTYGVATALPWGIDFGDGVMRHPTQLYEIAFLLLFAVLLRQREQNGLLAGQLFQFYFLGYFGFRFWIDFLKPDPHLLWGVSAIQLSCAIAVVILIALIRRGMLLIPDGRNRSGEL